MALTRSVPANLRYATRRLLRGRSSSLAMILLLAVGIGGVVAVFSFVNALLLRPLPVRDPGQLAWIGTRDRTAGLQSSFTYPDFRALQDGGGPFSQVAAFGPQKVRLSVGSGAPTDAVGAFVSASYFPMLDVPPFRGRMLGGGTTTEVVLSHATWRGRFAADPGIIGRTISLNGVPFTVVGVAPPAFGGTISLVRLEFWIPLEAYSRVVSGGVLDTRNHRWLQVIGRVKPGLAITSVHPALKGFEASLPGSPGLEGHPRVEVQPLAGLNGEARTGVLRAAGLL
ncbi:MAG TPA: ABC transporter permease, partial [Longimicrobiaceae bacterium]|nr:ABC transporter permease [Longimicrobiaceae bacterium]